MTAAAGPPVAANPAGAAHRRALATLFPLFVVTEVVASQPWHIGPFQPGQLLSWANIFVLAVVIFTTPGMKTWPRLLIGAIFAAKLGVWLTGIASLDLVYRGALVASAAVAGMILAMENPGRVRRQAATLMMITAPVMLLQAAGAGAWSQALSTHGAVDQGEAASKDGIYALFVSDVYTFRPNLLQLRPAGVLHSNQFASLVILFALVMLVTNRGPRRRAWDFAVCLAAVLSMAKVVLMGTVIAVGWMFVTGDALARRRAWQMGALFTLLLIGYRVVFPGLFAGNLNVEAVAFSVLGRALDVASLLGYGALIDRQLYQVFSQQVTIGSGDSQSLSGIGQAVRYLPLFLGVVAVGVPTMLIAFHRMRRQSRVASRAASTMLLCGSLFLAAGPFLGSPTYWLFMGFGLVPLMAVIDPRYTRARLAAATSGPARPAAPR